MTNLFINADDFGRSKNISTTILECIDNGIVNSVSVIMGLNDEIYVKLKNRNVKTKLHINLTDFPLNHFKNDKFLNNLSFLKLLFLSSKKRRQIFKIITNQIEEYVKIFGEKNLIIDGHQHIQAIPWIYEYLISKSNYKVKEIRLPKEEFFFVDIKSSMNFKFFRNLIAHFLLNFLVKYCLKNKIYSPSYHGMVYSGFYNKKILEKNLQILNKDKVTEIAFHPGYSNDSEKDLFKSFFFNYYINENRIIENKLAKNKNF